MTTGGKNGDCHNWATSWNQRGAHVLRVYTNTFLQFMGTLPCVCYHTRSRRSISGQKSKEKRRIGRLDPDHRGRKDRIQEEGDGSKRSKRRKTFFEGQKQIECAASSINTLLHPCHETLRRKDKFQMMLQNDRKPEQGAKDLLKEKFTGNKQAKLEQDMLSNAT